MSLPSLSLSPVRKAGWREVLLANIAFAVALLAIWRLVPHYGISVAALLTVPLAVLAWSFGLKGALLGSLVALPAGTLLCVRVTSAPLLQVTSGHLGILLIACVTGRLRDLSMHIGHELDEHAQAVRLLRYSEARNQALLSALPDLIFRLDASGKVSGASGARGRASSMRSATYLDQLIPAEAAELMRERAREVLRAGEPGELEYRVSEHEDGRDYEARLVKCAQDQVLVIVRNVTRQKRLERELIAAKEAALDAARSKTKFLANMSHEIRTPMNGVIGMTNLLLETSLSTEQREYAQIIQKSGQSLLLIIDDILDFAKIEAGRLELDRIEFDLQSAVEESVAAVAGQAYAKGLDLGSVFERGAPRRVIGDPTRVRQVLANLLGNAVKFTEAGYVLLVVSRHAASAPHVLRFEVRDTGPGVPPELHARLFRPLLLGEAGGGSGRDGTGLGLAIAHELVQLMGGEISHESRPGEGAVFAFTARLEAVAAEEAEQEADLKSSRVLVPRANEAPKRLLDAQLASLGIEATFAPEGDLLSAIEAARASGRAFLALLIEGSRDPQADERIITRVRCAHPALPIVLVLPSEARDGRFDELRRSASRVLGWPLSRGELSGCLAALLGRSDAVVASAPAPALLSARVLVAEDNLINQRVAQRTLQLIGCESEVVEDGRAAVEAALAGSFDIVLMDCQMPVMDGFEAAAEIRAREVGRRTPIVAMTAGVADAERERWREAQMDAYVTKPIGVDELRETIAKLTTPAPPAQEEVLDRAALDELRGLGDDEFLKELVRMFVEQAPRNLEVARAALDVGDLEVAAKAAHTIKSSSGYLGARRLAHLCVQLEQRARSGEVTDVGRALEALTAEYDLVRHALLAETGGASRGTAESAADVS